jgi:GNAT superfamily N-acetyltransferase
MGTTVRRATPSDVGALVRFNSAMAEETEGNRLSLDVLETGVRSVFDDPSKGFYVVAETEGAPVGSLLVTPEWSDWRSAYYWWVQSVYVLPAHRGRGIYTALHRYVERLARAAGNVCRLRLYVDIKNSTAKNVYEKLGMARSRYEFFESGDLTGPKPHSDE